MLLDLQSNLGEAYYCSEGQFHLELTPYSLTIPSNEVNYAPHMSIVLVQITSKTYDDETLCLLLHCSQASAFTSRKCDEFYLRAQCFLFLDNLTGLFHSCLRDI